MNKLLKNEAFCIGLAMGINIFQQIFLAAYDRKEPLNIDGKLFYVQSGDELLAQMIDAVCQ